MKSPDESAELRALLREWKTLPPAAPGLAAQVRTELVFARQKARPRGVSWRMAFGALTLGGLLGVAAVEAREARAAARRAPGMPASYLSWIDPQAGVVPETKR